MRSKIGSSIACVTAPAAPLDQTPPVQHWQKSMRQLPDHLDDPWYDADHKVRRVRPTGQIRWRGELVFIGASLSGQLVRLAEHESGGTLVRFCHRDVGVIDRARRFLRFAPQRARLRRTPETADDTEGDARPQCE